MLELILTIFSIGFFLFFILLWLIGVISWFMGMVYGIKLRNRVKKLNPKIDISFFIFLDKGINRAFRNFPSCYFGIFNVLLNFGSKKIIEEWSNCFMDVKSIKNLKDRKVDIYFKKLVSSISIGTKVWVLLLLSFLLFNGLFLLLKYLILAL